MRDKLIIAAQDALDRNWRENHRMMATAAVDAMLAMIAEEALRLNGIGLESSACALQVFVDRASLPITQDKTA